MSNITGPGSNIPTHRTQGRPVDDDANADNVKAQANVSAEEQASETVHKTKKGATKLDTNSKITKTKGNETPQDKQIQNEKKSAQALRGISLLSEKPELKEAKIDEKDVPKKMAQAGKIIKNNQKNGINPNIILKRASEVNPRVQQTTEQLTEKVKKGILALQGQDPKLQLLKINALMAEVTAAIQKTLTEKELADDKKAGEAADKYFSELAKRDKARNASKASQIFQKIFKWIGVIFQVIAAVIVKALAVAATAGTLGAASPLLALSTSLMISAVMSVITAVLEESGAMQAIIEKVLTPLFMTMGLSKEKAMMAATIYITVEMIGIQIAAMAFTGGTSGVGAVSQVAEKTSNLAQKLASTLGPLLTTMTKAKDAEAALEMVGAAVKVSHLISQSIVTVGQATVGASKSVADYMTAEAEVGMIEVKKQQENIGYSKEETAELVKMLEKLKQQMAKDMSTIINEDTKTMSSILSRMSTA